VYDAAIRDNLRRFYTFDKFYANLTLYVHQICVEIFCLTTNITNVIWAL